MVWTNYHSHTHFSDGKGTPEAFIEAAIAQGLCAYGISDHGPHPFSGDANLKETEVKDYVKTINDLKARYSEQIELYCSVEVDYIPDHMDVNKVVIKDAGFDYTICSVHHAGFFAPNEEGKIKIFSIDNSGKGLVKGIAHIHGGDTRTMVEYYYALTRQMLLTAPPDVLGHLDRIKKNNSHATFFSEKENWYRAAIEETVDMIAKTNVIVEVNTKSYYKNYTTDPDPSYWILEMLLDRKVPIHLSGDTHEPIHVKTAFEEVAARLMQIGFKKQRVFLGGTWQDIPLGERSIHFVI